MDTVSYCFLFNDDIFVYSSHILLTHRFYFYTDTIQNEIPRVFFDVKHSKLHQNGGLFVMFHLTRKNLFCCY
jgi:hypothetical protein